MAEARQRHDWCMASSLMALIANAHRDPKKHGPFKPADFDPTTPTSRSQAQPIQAGVGVLKDVFIDRCVPSRGGGKEVPS